MGCDCYQIGGPFIAEDPNCPAHGQGGLQDELNAAHEDLANAREAIRQLKERCLCPGCQDCRP